MSVSKQRCDVCGFMVNPIGHEERCTVQGHSSVSVVTTNDLWKAWIGDNAQRMDVRLAAVLLGVPFHAREDFSQQYISNASMRQYMLILDPTATGSAERLGTEFECRYHGDFRVAYLYAMFPAVAETIISMWSPPNALSLFSDV